MGLLLGLGEFALNQDRMRSTVEVLVLTDAKCPAAGEAECVLAVAESDG